MRRSEKGANRWKRNGRSVRTRRSPHLEAIGVWFVFLVIAFAFGTVRELAVRPLMGEYAAHVVGTLVVVAAFLGVIVWFARRAQGRCSAGDFWSIGAMWLVMTVSFEFLFFHFVGGKPWAELRADYNVAQGRIWVLVPLATLFGPPAIHAILQPRAGDENQNSNGPRGSAGSEYPAASGQRK